MIKTIFSFFMVILTMLILTPIGFIVTILNLCGLKRPLAGLIYRVAQGWALLLISFVGCKVTVSGRENIPRKGGLCFVSNHGSIFDILLLLAYAGRPVGFVAKKELLFIPFLNIWIFVLGGLFIDRKNVRNAINTINRGIARLKSGGAMIIFPEGHRSRGQGLLPFHAGSLKLATQAEACIVPVALAGTYDVFEKERRVISSVQVKVTFCAPISTADLPATDRKLILSDQIHGVIKAVLAEK